MATGTTPFTRGVVGSNSFTYSLRLPNDERAYAFPLVGRPHHYVCQQQTDRAITNNSTDANGALAFFRANAEQGVGQCDLDCRVVVAAEANGFHQRLELLSRGFSVNNRHAHSRAANGLLSGDPICTSSDGLSNTARSLFIQDQPDANDTQHQVRFQGAGSTRN